MTAQTTKSPAGKKSSVAKSEMTLKSRASAIEKVRKKLGVSNEYVVTRPNVAKGVLTNASARAPERGGFRPLSEVLTRRPRFGLATIREAVELSQVQVASAMGKEQSTVSRLEKGEDWLVSTLEAYAKALGGAVEVNIRIGRHSYRVR